MVQMKNLFLNGQIQICQKQFDPGNILIAGVQLCLQLMKHFRHLIPLGGLNITNQHLAVKLQYLRSQFKTVFLILLWKLVITDGMLAVLTEETTLQQTKCFLIGDMNLPEILYRSAIGDKKRIQRRILLRLLLPLVMLQKLLEFMKRKLSL